MRLKNDFPGAYPEGEVEEAMRTVQTMRDQRHARQCNLHGTNCGDDSLVKKQETMTTTVAGAYGSVKIM